MPNNVEAIRVSVGSTADISKELAKKHNIIVVPGLVTFGEETIIDNPDFLLPDLFAKIDASKDFPRTAAPGTEVFKMHWAEYDGPILPITAGDKISTFYNAAVLARTDLRELPDGQKRMNIYEPWNSLNVSLGEGFPALIAAEMLEQGVPIVDVIRKLDEVRERVYVFAVAESPEYFGKSGKISGTKAFLGQMLQIKPCVTSYNNEIVPFKNYRTYRAANADLADFAEHNGPIERMAVLYTDNKTIAMDMVKVIQDRGIFDPKEIIVGPVTKVVASHTGRNTLGFVFVGAARRK